MTKAPFQIGRALLILAFDYPWQSTDAGVRIGCVHAGY